MSIGRGSSRGHAACSPTSVGVASAQQLATRRRVLGLGVAATAGLLADRAGSPESARAAPEAPVSISVKDYGAKGDGVADDTEAFERALTAAKQSTLFVPAGTFRITKTLSIPQATSITGLGQSSIIQAVGCHALSFAVSTSICPSKISDFTLRGDGAYEHDAIRSEGTTEEGDEVNSVNIERIMFQSWRHGIYGRTIWRWNISRNMFYEVWQPIEVVGQSVIVRIENNLMLRGAATGTGNSTGIYVAGTADYNPGRKTLLVPQDVQAHGNTIQEYEVGICSYECLLARYRDNDIDSCALYGIAYAWSSGGIVIDGNWIGGTTGFKYGVYAMGLATVQTDSHATIVNNHITGEEGEPSTESIGIFIYSNHQNLVISGNDIDHMLLNDIRVQNCMRARMLDNFCNSTATTHSIYVIGTRDHTLLDRNFVATQLFVDPNPKTNAIVYIGDTYGAQSTRICGKLFIPPGKTEAAVKYSELNGKPPEFNGGASSYLAPHLRIEAPEAKVGALWGTATNDGVKIHCEKSPAGGAVIRWEVTTQGYLD